MAVTAKRTLLPTASVRLRGEVVTTGAAAAGAERTIIPSKPTATTAASLAATAVNTPVVPEGRGVQAVPGAGVVRIAPPVPTAINWPLKNVMPRR